MGDPPGFELRLLDIERDAQALADMWNASDAEWPGTWTRGVPWTAERARLRYDRWRGYATLVYAKGRQIAGICELTAAPEEPGVDYVAMLNVAPAFHKKGLARRMLQRALAMSVQRGSSRLDLGTWPANLSAVPLYKKCGFFWEPDTQVHMRNFLPGILRMPVTKRFLRGRDWYGVLDRALEQSADDERWEGLKVYTYRFADGDVALTVRVDREARVVCAVETDDFLVSAVPSDPEPPHGLSTEVQWRVENRAAQPLPVTVFARGGDGLRLEHHESLMVGAGEGRSVAAPCEVEAGAADRLWWQPAPSVPGLVVLGDTAVEVSAGLMARPAFEVSTWPPTLALAAGSERTVEIILRSRLHVAAEATISVTPPPGISASWTSRALNVPAEGHSSAEIELCAKEPGAFSLPVGVSFSQVGRLVAVRPEPRPVFSLAPGRVLWAQGRRSVSLTNGSIVVTAYESGGGISVSELQGGQPMGSCSAGPGFYPNDLVSAEWDLEVVEGAGRVSVIATAESREKPGLVMKRVTTLCAGPVLEIALSAENRGLEPVTLSLSHSLYRAQSITGSERLVLPLVTGLVEAAPMDFPGDDEALSRAGAWAEGWAARVARTWAFGVVWGADVERVEQAGASLRTGEAVVRPQSSISAEPLLLYAGPGGWEAVRDLWRQRTGRMRSPDEERLEPVAQTRARFEPAVVTTAGSVVDTTLVVERSHARPLVGGARLALPDGWRSDVTEVSLEGLTWQRPSRTPFAVSAPGHAAAGAARVSIGGPELDADLEVPVLCLGDGSRCDVREGSMHGQQLLTIANGSIEADVAPDFAGTTVSLRAGGAEQLASAFPAPGRLGWQLPWYGGIGAFCMAGNPWPGLLTDEVVAAAEHAEKDGYGVTWSGVRLSAELAHYEARGLLLEVLTLTTGASPVVKHVVRLRNGTGARRSVFLGTNVAAAPGASGLRVTLVSPRGTSHHSDRAYQLPGETWVGALDRDTGDCVLVAARGDVAGNRVGADGSEIRHGRAVHVAGGEEAETVTYVVAAASLDEARPWAALTGDRSQAFPA